MGWWSSFPWSKSAALPHFYCLIYTPSDHVGCSPVKICGRHKRSSEQRKERKKTLFKTLKRITKELMQHNCCKHLSGVSQPPEKYPGPIPLNHCRQPVFFRDFNRKFKCHKKGEKKQIRCVSIIWFGVNKLGYARSCFVRGGAV